MKTVFINKNTIDDIYESSFIELEMDNRVVIPFFPIWTLSSLFKSCIDEIKKGGGVAIIRNNNYQLIEKEFIDNQEFKDWIASEFPKIDINY